MKMANVSLIDGRVCFWLFAARKVDFLASEFTQLRDDFLEAIHRDGWLTRLAPMPAHLAFEIVSVVDFDFHIKRLGRTHVQNRFLEIVFFVCDGVKTVHGL